MPRKAPDTIPALPAEPAARATRSGRALRSLLPLLGAAVPPIVVARAIVRHGVNVPYWDQWMFVPLLVDTLEGRFRLGDLWAQHNEHRIVLPRLVMLVLARLSHWNVRWEMAASVIINLVTLGVLVALVRRTVRPLASVLVPWLVLIASVLLFSLSQWENWISGWQVQIFMVVQAGTVAAWLIAGWNGGWPRLALLLVVGVAGVLSFGSGLVLLALVPPAAWIAARARPMAARLGHAAAASAVLVAVGCLYYAGFEYPGHHPSPLVVVQHPLAYVAYVLAYVGAGFGAWNTTVAAWWGGCGLAAYVGGSAWLWRQSEGYRVTIAPWVFLAVFAVLTGVVTGIGRAGMGTGQAIAGRYVSISALFWLSFAVVAALVVADILRRPQATLGCAFLSGALVATVLALAADSYARSWQFGRAAVKERERALKRGGACLLDYSHAPDGCLRSLFISPEWIRQQAVGLERNALGPFAARRRDR